MCAARSTLFRFWQLESPRVRTFVNVCYTVDSWCRSSRSWVADTTGVWYNSRVKHVTAAKRTDPGKPGVSRKSRETLSGRASGSAHQNAANPEGGPRAHSGARGFDGWLFGAEHLSLVG